MFENHYDVIIIGSGAGGSSCYHSLASRGMRVLLLEQGTPQKIGTVIDSLNYYDLKGIFRENIKSREGVIIWQALVSGGSTVVACGNGGRCLEKELSVLGITMENEFLEAEKDMGVKPISLDLLGTRSKRIMQAAKKCGYNMDLMPKVLQLEKCQKCGDCIFGCKYNAKWTSRKYLKKTDDQEIVYNAKVTDVIVKDNKAVGVNAIINSKKVSIHSKVVICAAGAINSPIILMNSGLKNVGTNLFVDMLVNVYGSYDEEINDFEPTMALVNHQFYESDGFIISPYLCPTWVYKLKDIGLKGVLLNTRKLNGLMIKIRDDSTGQVFKDGSITKKPTTNDMDKLNKGIKISKTILLETGINPRSIIISNIQGAHSGGTCAIGKVVDTSLETHIQNLFVCDASVLPTSPGLPTIVTLTALGKRLAKSLQV